MITNDQLMYAAWSILFGDLAVDAAAFNDKVFLRMEAMRCENASGLSWLQIRTLRLLGL